MSGELVAVATRLCRDHRAVLVGGLAVLHRLGTAHRATVDVDTVTDGPITVVSGTVIDGYPVDVIDTYAVDAASLPDDATSRLFVVAHRWAFDTGEDLDGMRVATVAALVATKAAALANPRRSAAKRESDTFDLWRLLETEPDMHGAPFDLDQLVDAVIAAHFIDGALRASNLIRLASPIREQVDPDDIRAVAAAFLAR